VSFALGQKLFEAANEPKQFIKNPGGGHSDAPTEEFTIALDQFLNELPPIEPKMMSASDEGEAPKRRQTLNREWMRINANEN
jgi:hypothetical protein